MKSIYWYFGYKDGLAGDYNPPKKPPDDVAAYNAGYQAAAAKALDAAYA